MTRKAPGKAHREGLTLVELMDMFPTEEGAAEWFEIGRLASRSPLFQMRLPAHPRSVSPLHAVLVRRLPVVFQRQDGDGHAGVENPAA